VLQTLVLQGSAQGFLLLLSMLMARRLSIQDFGSFVFGFQFGQLCAGIAALGATFYLAKHFAASSDRPDSTTSTFELHNRYFARGAGMLMVVWAVFALFGNDWVAIGSFGISAANLATITLMAFFTAIGKAPLGNLLQAGRGLVLCLAASLPMLFLPNLDAVVVVLTAAMGYALIAYLAYARMYSFRIAQRLSSDHFEFARQHVYAVVLVGVDVIILKLVSSAENVAIYGVGLFLSSIASFALYAINANYTAPISKSLRGASRGDTQDLLTRVARINALLTSAFIVLLVVFAMNLTLFYGEEFEASKVIFLVLLLGQAVNVSVGSVALVANVSGYESRISSYILHAVLLKLAAGAAASYFFGALGMACVASLANAMWNFRSFLLVRQELGLNTTIFPLPKPAKSS
jgi:O-antigen/teichoic acid export membrane protein